MKKFIKKYLSGVMVLFLSFCLVACGSTAGKKSVSTFKTQELFSKYSKDKGIHMGISMKNNGTDISVDIYQLGEKMYLDATSGEDRFLYIVKDDILTVLDPVNKVYEQREITDDVEKQLKTVTSGMDNILEIGQMDIKYEKGTVKLDGMEYDTEEVLLIEVSASDVKVYPSGMSNCDSFTSPSKAVILISVSVVPSILMTYTSLPSSLYTNFIVLSPFTTSSVSYSMPSSLTVLDPVNKVYEQREITEDVCSSDLYSFKTADYNIISKNGEVTTVFNCFSTSSVIDRKSVV